MHPRAALRVPPRKPRDGALPHHHRTGPEPALSDGSRTVRQSRPPDDSQRSTQMGLHPRVTLRTRPPCADIRPVPTTSRVRGLVIARNELLPETIRDPRPSHIANENGIDPRGRLRGLAIKPFRTAVTRPAGHTVRAPRSAPHRAGSARQPRDRHRSSPSARAPPRQMACSAHRQLLRSCGRRKSDVPPAAATTRSVQPTRRHLTTDRHRSTPPPPRVAGPTSRSAPVRSLQPFPPPHYGDSSAYLRTQQDARLSDSLIRCRSHRHRIRREALP